jgi:hypothetical protein
VTASTVIFTAGDSIEGYDGLYIDKGTPQTAIELRKSGLGSRDYFEVVLFYPCDVPW